MRREDVDLREYVARLLSEVEDILRRPEDLTQGDLHYVQGWVEEAGSALRVVYDREGGDRRFGYRVAVTEVPVGDLDESGEDAVSVAAYLICENLDEPLGRFWDLLVEEDGVWWWGDGYRSILEHPDLVQRPWYRRLRRPRLPKRRRYVVVLRPPEQAQHGRPSDAADP